MSDEEAPIKRKLIEVALPLEAINRASAREKSIRYGHPSTLHLWWARRPLAACRAVLFAQLVDDPSAHLDRFPTEEAQAKERRRLFDLIEKLVVWENITNETLLQQAHEEIAKCFQGKPPAILDPFAGGGSIPLEAQRLGLEAHASDLNPVAVLINKALIEIPAKWTGRPPVYPGVAESQLGDWSGATGLAEDVRWYGQWMRYEAEKRIGHLYPKAKLPDGSEANVIAWIWARTITCPNPACGSEIPLASTWWLSKKADRPTWIQPVINGKQVNFEIKIDKTGPPNPPKRGQGANFVCLICDTLAGRDYVHGEFASKRNGQRLLAVVAAGDRQRTYLGPTEEHRLAAEVAKPQDAPDQDCRGTFGGNAQGRRYGFQTFADYFTNRQLVALTTLSDMVGEARNLVAVDARKAGLPEEAAEQYANAVATYLALALSRTVDRNNSLCTWDSGPAGSRSSTGGSARTASVRNAFARQALPMTWDFAEANPFSESGGSTESALKWIVPAIQRLPGGRPGVVRAENAVQIQLHDEMAVCTDPPYYDNIGYADLSDFFYVWLRRILGQIYHDVTGTMLTPKSDELIANPYRFAGSKAAAEEHFERGFVHAFTQIQVGQVREVPTTIFYAFKQAEADEHGVASTGWETMLTGLIEAGLSITATWPMRTELGNRMLGSGTNALASSIVLACRPRSESSEGTSRRGLVVALEEELPRALRRLQQGSVAPVDLAQAAVGPGMAVFSRYAKVVEPDGSDMTVRTALTLINQALDEVLSEQEGDFDTDTRFCVRWFRQFGWDEQPYGRADELSRSTNTSVDGLVRGGVFWARAGKARLLEPSELSADWDPATDERISVWEVVLRLAKALSEKGGEEAARLMTVAGQRIDLDAAKELAYLLFSVCERRGWTQTALLFNGLGTSWSDLSAAARAGGSLTPPPAQGELDFTSDEE